MVYNCDLYSYSNILSYQMVNTNAQTDRVTHLHILLSSLSKLSNKYPLKSCHRYFKMTNTHNTNDITIISHFITNVYKLPIILRQYFICSLILVDRQPSSLLKRWFTKQSVSQGLGSNPVGSIHFDCTEQSIESQVPPNQQLL